MNFKEVFNKVKTLNPAILLGNGFSKGLFDKIGKPFNLSYKNIRDEVKIKLSDPDLIQFLNENENHPDLEYLIKMMDYAVTSFPFISPTYHRIPESVALKIKQNKELLKSITLQSIRGLHEDYSTILDPFFI